MYILQRVVEFDRQILRGDGGSIGATNYNRTGGGKTRLVGENRDSRSRWEDDAPDEGNGQTNTGIWSTVEKQNSIGLKSDLAEA
ncbi:hypothetical protein TNCV_3147371 [Trichonephila clavipes]|nr:hypothetical protein TNCV_3147371 [Trichonephila clavipes]